MEKNRCKWCNLKNETYVKYHDEEWGIPTYDDKTLFEFLILEPFQAGLSWETILNKRESFQKAFDHYNIDKICCYGEKEIAGMMENPSIIRNRRKIEAAINNARIFREIQSEWESFSKYIWHFTNGKIIYEVGKTQSALSDQIAEDMKKRGMKFIRTTTVYAYLQSIGMINSHERDCFLYKDHAAFTDRMISDFSSPLFRDAFQQYFTEIGVHVTDWNGLFREMDAEGGNSAFVRTAQDDKIIGFIQFRPIKFSSSFFEETFGFIREFWVSDGFRGSGHGAALLRLAENYFHEQGIYTSILTTDSAAQFYEKHGYCKASGCRAKNGDDVFIKRLEA